MTLSPDTIKTIAKQIRAAEERDLGAKISNTTALNAITRALGLGNTFSGYVAKSPEETFMATILIAIPSDNETLPCSARVRTALLMEAEKTGMKADLTEGAHNYSQLILWEQNSTRTQAELDTIRKNLLAFLAPFVEDLEIEKPVGSLAWLNGSTAKDLTANFEYHDNEQICSGGLNETAWKNRKALGVSDTEAFLLLYTDVDIEPFYTADDITLQDIMYSVEFYYD